MKLGTANGSFLLLGKIVQGKVGRQFVYSLKIELSGAITQCFKILLNELWLKRLTF